MLKQESETMRHVHEAVNQQRHRDGDEADGQKHWELIPETTINQYSVRTVLLACKLYSVCCWCATAHRPSCQDSADWCRQLYAGQCYDKTVEQVCCATCSRHLTSQPGESLSSLHSVRLSVSSTHICNHFCAKDGRSLYIVLTHFAASLYVQTRIHLLPPFWWR